MDDKSPNATQSSIDDLVKELSRPQSAPLSIPRPSAPVSGPTSSSVPKPAVPTSPKPAPAPQSATPNAPKEYQSSIRTMSDDLSKIKSGQQLQGTSTPRKVEPMAPAAPKTMAPPAPAVPKGPTIQANLGQTQKAVPLAPSPLPPKPVRVLPPSPVQKDQYNVPPTAGNRSRFVALAGILIGVIALGAAYWYFMIREPMIVVEEPTPTFTPRPSVTPANVLSIIFPDKSGTIILPDNGDPTSAFNTALNVQSPVAGKLAVLNVANSVSEGSAQTMDTWELMDRFLVSYPQSLRQSGTESAILIYGQKESFDAQGRLVVSSPISSRIALVSEVASAEMSLAEWEPTMDDSLSGLLGLDKSKDTGPFSDNAYQGAAVRYNNFPYPDRSIDYALVRYGGKTYLILANSRESMFSVIDAFLSNQDIPGK